MGMLHGLLKRILRQQRKHRFESINDIPKVSGPCIYAVNHSCKWDLQYMMELTPKNTYFWVRRQPLNLIDRIGIIWKGVVWVDRKSKTDKAKAKEKLNRLLESGKSICVFPEATWNLMPSTPMLPMTWGIIELAQMREAPIVPICLEYKDDVCRVKFANHVYVSEAEDKEDAISYIRDIMATMKWEIWKTFPVEKRCSLESNYWENYVRSKLAEYPKLNYEYEMSCVRKQ